MPTEQLDAYRQALRLLNPLYGETPAGAFGCPELDAVREVMIRPRTDAETGLTLPGWCRTHANRQVGRIRHVFGWAVTKNLVPIEVYQRLLLLPGWRAGKSGAKERPPVRPVDEERAFAIVPHISARSGR